MAVYSFPVQAALAAALQAASVAGGRIHDDAPDGVAYPWVEIGDSQAIPDDTSAAVGGDDGVAETFTLHVWDRGYRGSKRVRETIAAIHGALHGAELTVSGRSSAIAWIRTDRVFRDTDGITQHGVVDVEIIHRS